jgi:hypothetical protein
MSCNICEKMLHTVLKAETSSDSSSLGKLNLSETQSYTYPTPIRSQNLIWTIVATHTLVYHPNLGFEQALLDTHLALRFGLDETSPTAGLSLKFARYKLDAAYVDNMARSRVGNLFGDNSRSFLLTFTFDYGAKRPQSRAPSPSQE